MALLLLLLLLLLQDGLWVLELERVAAEQDWIGLRAACKANV